MRQWVIGLIGLAIVGAVAYNSVRLWAQAVEETDDDAAVIKAVRRQSIVAPEGIISIDGPTLHTWRPVYIGRIRSDGQFDAVWSSGKTVRPIAFPHSRPWSRWEELLDELHRGWNGWANPGPAGPVSKPATTPSAAPARPSDPPPDSKRATRSAAPRDVPLPRPAPGGPERAWRHAATRGVDTKRPRCGFSFTTLRCGDGARRPSAGRTAPHRGQDEARPVMTRPRIPTTLWSRTRISTHLLLYFLCISLIPCGLLTVLTLYISSRSLERSVRQTLMAVSDAKATQLEVYIRERRGDLSTIGRTPSLMDAYFDGLRSGLLVTFVAAIAANAPLAGPPRTFLVRGAGDWIALALFALSGALISGLGESLHRARRHNLSDGQRPADRASYDVEERKRSEAALRESEERFRGTFENAGVGIGHFDFEGRWLRVNQRQCDILGYTREEILRRSIQDLTYPDDLASIERFHQLTRGEVPGYALEKRYVRKDGTPVWTHITTSVRRDAAGTPAYVIAVVQDIAERKRLEQAEAERARLAEFGRGVGIALGHGETFAELLQPCAEALVRHLDAALARIWYLPSGKDVLELQANAGLRGCETIQRFTA